MSWGSFRKLETIEGVGFLGNFFFPLSVPGGEARSAVFYGSGGVSNVILSLMQTLIQLYWLYKYAKRLLFNLCLKQGYNLGSLSIKYIIWNFKYSMSAIIATRPVPIVHFCL